MTKIPIVQLQADLGNGMEPLFLDSLDYQVYEIVATQAKEIELLRSVIEEHLDIELPEVEPVVVERHKDPEEVEHE